MSPNLQNLLLFKQLYKVIDLFYFYIKTQNRPDISFVTLDRVKYTRKWVAQQISKFEIFRQYRGKVLNPQEFAQNTEAFNDLIETLELRKQVSQQIQETLSTPLDSATQESFNKQLEQVGKLPEPQQEQALNNLAPTSTQSTAGGHPSTPIPQSPTQAGLAPPRLTPIPTGTTGAPIRSTPSPSFKPSSGIKNITRGIISRAGIFFKKNVGKFVTPARALSTFTGVTGGIVGFGLGGGLGALAGAGAGAGLPSFIKSGGGKFFGRAGNFAINAGANFSNRFSRMSIVAPKGKVLALALIFGFGLIFFVIFSAPFLPQDQQQVAVAQLSSGNINSCQFTRGDQNPTSASYKSQTLMGYFQEASIASGVPTAVLAGIARVESPGIVYLTDDKLPSFGCPTSPTGAKGLMQIQPPGTNGHPAAGVALGAKYLGIPVEQLNYCNLRQSIFLGAGVVNSKRLGGKWDPARTYDKAYIDSVAETYYGCLRYPSCSSGPYSYGDDLYSSVINCRSEGAQTIVYIGEASCPIPGGKIGCASYGKPEPWGGFHNACAVDSTGNGGHCNQNYVSAVGICLNRDTGTIFDASGNLIRTAKSIDVAAAGSRGGDPVYLPTIRGKSLNWYYKGVVDAGSTFGWIRLFQSEPTPEGIYSIHFVHVNSSAPPMAIDQPVKSGELGATLFPLSDWPHAHITVGLNVGDSTGDLKNHSPNWLFADRDLGMCTK